MKKLLFLPFFSLLASCYNTAHDCKDFKTGKFKFEYKIDGVSKTTVFERTENEQIETYEGKTDTATIRWVNDCEYLLQKKHPKSMIEKKAIDFKILTTSNKSYTFEFGLLDSEKKQRGIVTKID
jgi:hypothetical protein